jgi:hypothetical protein
MVVVLVVKEGFAPIKKIIKNILINVLHNQKRVLSLANQ